MDDYISRQAAIKYIKSKQCSKCSDIGLCGGCAVMKALKLLDEIPPADVRPAVRGRWIHFDLDSDRYVEVKCSVCRKHFTVDAVRWCGIGVVEGDLHYCPNCGADNRGGDA